MRERESEAVRLRWAIPAKIKKEGVPYIYEGTFKQYFDKLGCHDRFEFHYQNGATSLTFKIPWVDQRGGKTYMEFEGEHDQGFVVFFETHDLNLARNGYFRE